MDLIDRTALEREIQDALKDGGDIDGAFILNTLDAQPKVEAVPLEPLCEWLAENALEFPQILTDQGEAISAESWKQKLQKWMEESNDT